MKKKTFESHTFVLNSNEISNNNGKKIPHFTKMYLSKIKTQTKSESICQSQEKWVITAFVVIFP